jgi:hypothetical protein
MPQVRTFPEREIVASPTHVKCVVEVALFVRGALVNIDR